MFIRSKPTQSRSEEKFARILQVAQRLIAMNGAEATTTTRIAQESGVSVGTIYRFFTNREGLFNVLVAHELDTLDARLYAVGYSLAGDNWKAKADQGADVMIDFVDDEQLAYRNLMYTSTLNGEIAATNRQHDLRMAHYLLNGLPPDSLDAMKPDPLSVIHMYLGILDKGLELAFYKPGDKDIEILNQMKLAAKSHLERYLG